MGNKLVNFTTVKQGLYVHSSAAKGDIGSVMEFEDGRKFVYSLNGGETLTPGMFVQGPIENGYDESVVLAVNIAIGDKTVTLTVDGSRTYSANELKDGYVQVEDQGAGVIGHMRKIKSHPAAAASTSLILTLYDAWTDTATASTDTLNVMENPYNGVMIKNTTGDGPILGVAPCDVTATYYFWLQVAGPASVISGEATIVAGDGLSLDSSADVVLCDGANDEFVGWAMQSQASSGNAVMIMLCLGR